MRVIAGGFAMCVCRREGEHNPTFFGGAFVAFDTIFEWGRKERGGRREGGRGMCVYLEFILSLASIRAVGPEGGMEGRRGWRGNIIHLAI